MKYILLVVIMAEYGGYYNGDIRVAERTPVMFGGLFRTEGECMTAARKNKNTTLLVERMESLCVSVNGWDRKEKPDDPFTPFTPFTPPK